MCGWTGDLARHDQRLNQKPSNWAVALTALFSQNKLSRGVPCAI